MLPVANAPSVITPLCLKRCVFLSSCVWLSLSQRNRIMVKVNELHLLPPCFHRNCSTNKATTLEVRDFNSGFSVPADSVFAHTEILTLLFMVVALGQIQQHLKQVALC